MPLVLRELFSTSWMLHPLLLLLQHLFSVLLKCELHLLLLSFSQDIPKTYVLPFHRCNISLLLLYLFLFLWKNSFHHIVFLKNFLLFLSEYVLSESHFWIFVPCLGKLPCLCSELGFYLCLTDFVLWPSSPPPSVQTDKNPPLSLLTSC
jgi:hypothetical protein